MTSPRPEMSAPLVSVPTPIRSVSEPEATRPSPPSIAQLQWSQWIQDRDPQMSYDGRLALAGLFLEAGYSNPVVFKAISYSELAESRADWSPLVSDAQWAQVLKLRYAPLLSRPKPTESPPAVTVNTVTAISPALLMAGAFKVSAILRADNILRAILGLTSEEDIPGPNQIFALLNTVSYTHLTLPTNREV